MTINDIMTKPPVTCRAGDPLATAARLMWENDCGSIPVTNDGGNVVGMITDRDICMCAFMQGKCLDAIPVSQAMAKHVYSCRPSDSLEAAERLMREKQIRRVPVVDGDNRPIGVLSLNDIARAAATRDTTSGDHQVTHTLAAIGQPRDHAGTAH